MGFQNSAIAPALGFYAASSYSLMEPPGTGRRWIRSWETGDRAVRLGRPELPAAVGAAPAVVGRVVGQDCSQMPIAEDQHPAGDLGPGGEHEPLHKCTATSSLQPGSLGATSGGP